jgi:quercetin dioxygenase-like cupin family protein
LIRTVLAIIFVWAVAASTQADAQVLRCINDSPERRGQPGCSVVVEKRLATPLANPVMWHIDEFTSLAAAENASGPNSVAFEAHGSAWLYTIEADALNHHGGTHRALVGPLSVQLNRPYAIQVLSSYFLPGHVSIVHTHSGPEAWWVLEGEQCLETTTKTIRARAGEGAIVAAGETMRMVGIGAGPRRSLVLILHDAEQPASMVVEEAPALQRCR